MKLNKSQEETIKTLHRESMGLLLHTFNLGHLNSVPSPLRISITNEELGLMASLKKDSSGEIYMEINEDKHNSFIDLECSCVHETGHYLHILANRKEFYSTHYNQRELVAVASCFFYFERKNRSAEFIELVEDRDNPIPCGIHFFRERALLEMLKRGKKSYEVLQASLQNSSSILNEFEEVYNIINEGSAEVISGVK